MTRLRAFARVLPGLIGLVGLVALTIAEAPAAAQEAPSLSAFRDVEIRLEIDGKVSGRPLSFFDGLFLGWSVVTDPPPPTPGKQTPTEIVVQRPYKGRRDWSGWAEAVRKSLEGGGDAPRKNVSIVVNDANAPAGSNAEIKRWNCFECFPKSWKVSSLDGKGNDVMTEEMVVVIEYFEEG